MAENSDGAKDPHVQMHYIKTDGYREVPCHGVIGGPTPQGLLWMSLYAERPPIPRSVTFQGERVAGDPNAVRLNEKDAKPISVDTRTGVVRTIEVTTYLDLTGAKRLIDWLQTNVQKMEAPKV
jgi:hypothetical protein